MTNDLKRYIPVSEPHVFRNKDEVVEYILSRILANTNRLVGTEHEYFLVKSAGNNPDVKEVDGKNTFAITREDGQEAFKSFKEVFTEMGYRSRYIYKTGTRQIVGLKIGSLGTITPEIGGQIEFSSRVCETPKGIKKVNAAFHKAANEVAQRIGYVPVYQGHLPGHAKDSKGSLRERQKSWEELWDTLPESNNLREALNGTASVQVTVDAGAENFHRFFQTLLLIEPAFALAYANSDRSHVWMEAFEKHLPSQVTPMTEVWAARSPKEAVEAVVDVLMNIELPFLPLQDRPDKYDAEPFIGGRPATMKDLLEAGRLTEKTLNDVGGFALMRPAFRKFLQGLLELRGADSQATPEKVEEIARRATNLLYNDTAREELLTAYAALTPQHIQQLHKIAAMKDREEALSINIEHMGISGIKTMADFVENIIKRSDEAGVEAVLQSVRGRKAGTALEARRLVA